MMQRLARLVPIVLAVGLGACATQYRSSGLSGGHGQVSGPGQLERISFEGNGYTSADTAQKFALYRCAEVAKARGKPHFLIYDSLATAAAERPAAWPRVGTVANKPSAVAFLLALDAPRAGSRPTQSVLDELEPFVHQKASR